LHLSEDERQDLRQGRTLVRLLSAAEPSEIVVFAASHIDVTPQTFARRIRSPRLWIGPKVPRTGMLANPVRPDDIALLTLGADDLRALRQCRPGDCGVKLSSPEMARIQAAIRSSSSGWEGAAQHEFRQVILDRVSRYRSGGLSALGPFNDHERPTAPDAVYARLQSHAAAMTRMAPELLDYLQAYPRVSLPPGSEEFLYWIETVQPPKPTVQAWHITIRRDRADGASEVLAVSRQIFATHYVNGALAMTALVRDDDGRRYMVYLTRVSADGLTGFLSGIKRYFIERRIRSGARAAFDALRRRIES
jgi:hypothetical protein